VPVPLYTTDSLANIAYILGDSGTAILLVESEAQWAALVPHRDTFPALEKVLCLQRTDTATEGTAPAFACVDEWLAEAGAGGDAHDEGPAEDPGALATIVYTSGTTGRPKGVMLSHRNVISNIAAVLARVPVYLDDVFLSFLPVSHAFERTTGYYLPVATGSCVAYARSVRDLPADLLTVGPTVLISVPRIYERVYAKVQQGLAEKGAAAQKLFQWAEQAGWQCFEAAQRHERPGAVARLTWPVLRRVVADKILSRLGGRLRLAISGGAPLYGAISHCFVGLGLPLLQGYGLTEAAPVVTGNTLEDNVPESVGTPLPGIELRLGDEEELLVRGPNVMLGYWRNPEATASAIDAEGWLHTGDVARIAADGHVFIVGRLKEILVLSTGEKVAPADLEMAITQDPLFDQAMVIGEGRPYLAALLVLNPDAWHTLAVGLGRDWEDAVRQQDPKLTELALGRIEVLLQSFPAHARVRRLWLALEPWTIENGLITPTMKLKRPQLEAGFAREIAGLYAGHAVYGAP
jgi:long-chain acyl-CoA synthetase